MTGSRVGRRHLHLDLLPHWSSEPEGNTGFLDQWVSAKSKLAGMAQSVVRHLSKVQLLVISRGSSLVFKSSALDLN